MKEILDLIKAVFSGDADAGATAAVIAITVLVIAFMLLIFCTALSKRFGTQITGKAEPFDNATPKRNIFGKRKTRLMPKGTHQPEPVWRIDVFNRNGGPSVTSQLLYRGRGRCYIGYSSDCDIVINSEFVSGKHAYVVVKRNAFYLVDNNSTNGTFSSAGRKVSRVKISDGLYMRIGDHYLVFHAVK